jgi:hypothetical protein
MALVDVWSWTLLAEEVTVDNKRSKCDSYCRQGFFFIFDTLPELNFQRLLFPVAPPPWLTGCRSPNLKGKDAGRSRPRSKKWYVFKLSARPFAFAHFDRESRRSFALYSSQIYYNSWPIFSMKSTGGLGGVLRTEEDSNASLLPFISCYRVFSSCFRLSFPSYFSLIYNVSLVLFPFPFLLSLFSSLLKLSKNFLLAAKAANFFQHSPHKYPSMISLGEKLCKPPIIVTAFALQNVGLTSTRLS